MSVGNLNDAKGLAQSYKPLLLCTFTFADASVLRLCSDPLSTAQGGYPYGGNNYLARITNQDIATYQAMADGGIDMPGSVTIEMADPDKLLFLTWDQQSGRGFKGSALEMRLVLWNVGANDFSSDSKVIFQGVCDRPGGTATHLTVNAVTKLDFNKVFVPPARVQKRCFNIFPSTATERTAGNNDPSSTWYECGYCPEEGVGTAGFTDCGYTSADCKARGMYQHGRFSGITFAPNATFREKSFTEGGKEVFGINSNNEAKYSDFIPLIYGKGWIQPLLMNEIGGGDSTRFEAIICMGEVDDISNVVVNDVNLDQATLMDSTPQSVPEPLLSWNIVNRGSRNGAPNLLPGYDGKGDPYGSMCAITGTVFKRIADSESAPNVKVLVSGPKIRTFTGNSDGGTLQGAPHNQNPVWQLIDLMTWGPVTYADINLDLAATTANLCDETVSYVDANGATVPRPRYSSSLILKDRRTIAQVIRGLRTANGLIVYQRNGKIQIEAEGTLASQQPSPSSVAGTNDTTAYTSVLRSGSGANGYVAYHFDESNIRMTGSGSAEKSTLQLAPQAIASSPNVITTTFQDADWGYFPDSLTMRDAKDIGRSGREVDTSLQIDGIQTYDQAKRILTRTFARYNRGNFANDTRGTLVFKFSTTVQASHLHVGHIVSLSHEQWGFDRNLFRIRAITPQMNFDTVDIELEYHRDAWFRDDFGQLPDGDNTNPRRNQLPRPAWAWQPNTVFPLAGDPLYSVTDGTFAVSQSYEDLSDNNKLARVTIAGKLPQNNFGAVPPPFARQANGSSTGGSLHAGTVYWAVICAKDLGGGLSAPSGPAPIKAILPNGSTSGSFTIPNISWAQDTTGYALFASDDPNKLTKQLEGSGTPSSLTVTTLNKRTQGAPDIEFDHFRWDIRRIRHSGVAYGIVSSRTATTITLTGVSLTANQFSGREISVISLDSTDPVPFASFKIASHTATVLTLTGGSPSPIAAGVTAGAVLIFRSVPTAGADGTGAYISDTLWQNSEYPAGLETDGEQGNDLLCIAGAGQGFSYRIKANNETKIWIDGDWTVTPDATSRFIVVEPVGISSETSSIDNADPAADGNWTVDVSNYKGQPLLVTAVSVDGGGDGSWANTNPFREIYIYGHLSETPGGIPNPGDVTINLATGTIVGTTYIPSAFYTAPPDDSLFKGVHGYLEAPAVTASSRLDTDGVDGFQLPPDRIDLGQRPYDAAQNNSAGQQLIQFDAQDLPKTGFTARLYLSSYSDDVDVPLRAIGDASPTPNATFAVPSRPIFGVGQEHVPNVRNVQVTLPGSYLTGSVWYFRVNVTWEDPAPGDANYDLFQRVNVEFFDPTGKSMGSGYVAKGEQKFNWPQGICPATDEEWTVRVYSADAQGNQNTYSRGITPEVTFTAPQVPPTPHVSGFLVIAGYGYDRDGKLDLILAPFFHRPADDRGFQCIEFRIRDENGAFVVLGRPGNSADADPGARAYIEQQFWPATLPATWRGYAVPVSYAGIPLYGVDDPSDVGDSPFDDFTIPEYRGDLGAEYTTNATSFSLEVQYPPVGEDGVENYQFRWKTTKPDDERYAGSDIIVVPESDNTRSIVIASTSRDDDPDTWYYTDSWPVPAGDTFDGYAVGFNFAGNKNSWPVLDVTPSVPDLDVAPQSTGHLNAGRLRQSSLTTGHFDVSTGVLKWLGDPNVFVNTGGQLTVKLDPDNTVGISPSGIFINSVPFNKAKAGTYDTDIFTIPSGTFGVKFDSVANSQLQKTSNGISVKQIDAAIINTGILRVGNIANSPAYIGVYKLAGSVQTLIAWIGHNATYSGLQGGWFKELYVGGTDPLNPNLFADSNGNITLTGNILASSITGSTLTLLKNNVQTTITNFQEPAYGGAFVGVAVANLTASGRRSIMTAGGVACINPSQVAVADMYADTITNNGAVRVFNFAGALKCSMNGVDGSVHADLFNCGGFDGLGTAGSPVVILYTKSGGASGSLSFRGGILVAQT